MQDIIKKLDLPEKEAQTYVTLLKHPKVSATSLAKQVPYDRRSVYDILDTLFQKGYATITKENNVTKYIATDPIIILKEAEAKTKELAVLVPQLQNLIPKNSTNVETFKGSRGFRAITQDIIQRKAKHYSFGSITETMTPSFEKITKEFLAELEANNLAEEVIFDEKYKYTGIKKGKYKKLASELVPPTASMIYEDVTALFLNDADNTIIKITSEEIAKAYLTYFKVYWKMAK